jgi:hypothetical protein
MDKGGYGQQKTIENPGQFSAALLQFQHVGLRIDPGPFALEIGPRSARRVPYRRLTCKSNMKAFRRSAMTPVDIFLNTVGKTAHAVEPIPPAEQIAGANESLAFEILLDVERENAFERFRGSQFSWIVYKDSDASPHHIVACQSR